jgi:hypothetical protein
MVQDTEKKKQACRRQGSRGAQHAFIRGIYTTNNTGIKSAYHQLQGLNTELVYFGIKKISIEEKKWVNIEKYVENKLHINYTARPIGPLNDWVD